MITEPPSIDLNVMADYTGVQSSLVLAGETVGHAACTASVSTGRFSHAWHDKPVSGISSLALPLTIKRQRPQGVQQQSAATTLHDTDLM
jgi:hypothetical protein